MTISIFPNGQWRLPGHPMTPITKETAVTTEFSAKTALITGAGRGIGRAAALGLADAGASVILLARSDTQLAETRALLLARGAAAGQIRILAADLGDEDQRNRAAGAALAAGRIDILINNAATVEPIGATAAIPAAELRRAFAELRGTGVTVHAYRPGGVDTAMQAWIRQQDPERVGTALHVRFNRSYADGALITPERSAAPLIGYLSGDDTGAIWDVGAAPVRS